jgi:hypothetical protein
LPFGKKNATQLDTSFNPIPDSEIPPLKGPSHQIRWA